jgi:hypothetical protein
MARGLEDHWRKDSFDVLRRIIDLIVNGSHSDLYEGYLSYLELRQKGRRKEALATLDRFTATYKDDPFEIRHRICWSLIQWTEGYWDRWPAMDDWLFPANIGMKLMNPMFEEWRRREPRNVNAWLYPLRHGLEWGAETAFLLEPNNPRCQYSELSRILPSIGFAVHELDHGGYLLATPTEVEEMINSLRAVTRAMGNNFSDGAKASLNWLSALAAVHARTKGDLRPELEARGITKPKALLFYKTEAWFRDPPAFARL